MMTYNVQLGKAVRDSRAGLYLCSIISHHPVGWFQKHWTDIYADTALTTFDQIRSRKLLIKLGILEEKHGPEARPKYYLKINYEKLNELVNKHPRANPPIPVAENITKATYDLLMMQEKAGVLIALYTYYLLIQTWNETQFQLHQSSTNQASRALGIHLATIRSAHRKLELLGLIEIRTMNITGRKYYNIEKVNVIY